MLLCMMQACTTVTTGTIKEREIMIDARGEQTAGVLQMNEDGSVIVDDQALERYRVLAAQYGDRLTPPMGQDLGVSRAQWEGMAAWRVRPDRVVDWMTMTRWHRDGVQ